ncbi:DsbE family thiol:disulfide interchange protein [Aquisediminimonas profunda]|uniref:DsbE family thiol:disulfide interchange protein n=1 Tax=Aquisediminimonas profunda TaxID=1550733 RepID=UPI001C630267|nr:DsbE family thiol:disulfide interchange protein [Aquisediminimonas profunda]
MRRASLWLPFAIFVIFFGVVTYGLIKPSDHVITSKMIGKPLPQFALQPAHDGQAGLTNGAFSGGQPRLLNIFASWCIPCIAEAPVLMQLKSMGVEIDAIAIRDKPEDVARFLERNGNPYTRIGSDTVGKVQISLGSSGVPETFVIDGKGIIRHQHIGDIRADDIPEIMQALEAAK